MDLSLDRTLRVLLLFIFCFMCVPASDTEAQVGINVFGLSKHFEDSAVAELQTFNPGLGFHWTFDRGRNSALEFNTGIYRDSFSNLNRHLSLGARVRVWGPIEIGWQSILAKSDSMNDGYAIVYPIPFVSFRHSRFVLNTVYIPQVGSFNQISTLGLTATIFPFQNGFVWDDPNQQHGHRKSYLEFKIYDLTSLRGFQDLGVAWRRMFNPTHGLRLGYDLVGDIASFGEDSTSGNFRTRVMAQYLRRFSAENSSGCMVSAGVRLGFGSIDESNEMQYEILINLGWEYALNEKFQLFVETGLALNHENYHWRSTQPSDEPNSNFTTSVKPTDITMGISAGL